jgi:8-oxo-dGTP pyrophosphatase MutT (NUDIX family)
MDTTENPWKILNDKKVYANQWIDVTEYQVLNPAGGEGIYGKVSFKNIAIGIIPLDEQLNTWIVGQYRFTLNDYSWEIPMGGGPKEDDPLLSAKRELKEETGISADTWACILKTHTSNSVTDEMGMVYQATGLSFGEQELEDSESDLKIRKIPLIDALAMVENGEITDAISQTGLFQVARMHNL